MKEKDVFLKKFEDKLKTNLDKSTLGKLSKGDFEENISADYEQFRKESMPKSYSFYEKICNISEKLLNVKPDKKSKEKLDKQIFNAHLGCTSSGVQSASMLFPLILLFLGLGAFILVSSTIGFGIIIVAIGSYFALQKVPAMLARKMRAKANDQVIIGVFYIVAFMRFNSNFELAVNFAANYLTPPLSLDFKRLLWELDNGKYPNIKAAMDAYLEDWRDENLEFLEAIYLIESSLYESEDLRRITLLDKSLDIILQGNYEKMLHFAQELRGKVTTFNMIGIVLPILGLIILPLAASFGDPKSTWEIVFILYDIIIPALIGYFGFSIIFNRPSGANSIKPPSIDKKKLKQMQSYPLKLSKTKTIYVSPKVPAIFFFVLFLLIGFSPVLFHYTGIDATLNDKLLTIFGESSPFGVFQEYKLIDGDPSYQFGPYGTFPGILSLFIPLSFAFGIGYYLKYKYKNLISIRDKTKSLEKQFPSAMFQLGNRINEGISAELAFGAVSDTMKGTQAAEFFNKIDSNVKFNGMSIEAAVFDSEKGAINEYPSDLVISSMKIFIRAIEKGPEITAKTLIDLSRYLSEIHMSNERMKDLLAESLGSMKGQANFLAPIIAGVVISIVSLVTLIMGTLSKATKELPSEGLDGASASGFLGDSIPTFLFQGVVGVYIVLLILILIYMVSNLENGEDPIYTKYQMGEKVISGMIKYSAIVAIGIAGFAFIGAQILGSIV
ncbi:MAG: hypothetical protein ACOCXG_03695 [Nanoarchaeota archaeon]